MIKLNRITTLANVIPRVNDIAVNAGKNNRTVKTVTMANDIVVDAIRANRSLPKQTERLS